MNRTLAFRDLTRRIVLRFAKVLFDQAHPLDEDALLARQHLQNLTSRTPEVARDHLDLVAFLNVMLDPIHNTSGASETIFMKFRSRSSRATGPKIRVPRGFKSLSIITIAFLSKRRSEPSSRRIGCLVRTRTARPPSPSSTVPVGLASYTLAEMTSSIAALCAAPLPITPIIVAMRAPLLSATSNLRSEEHTSELQSRLHI